jgi:hypothetical protein
MNGNNPEKKSRIREIVLQLLEREEDQRVNSNDRITGLPVGKLKSGVAEKLAKDSGRPNMSNYEQVLSVETEESYLFMEVFWDLFLDRIITISTEWPGLPGVSQAYPQYWLRPDWKQNLEKARASNG